jgi:sugar phosphate permease
MAGKIYYGWKLLLTLTVTETVSWGILYYAFTVFIEPMQLELGWSRAAVTGAFSLGLLFSGVAGLLVGYWLDRHGPRLLMTLGSVASALLVLAWAGVRDLGLFYLIWAGLGICMAAVLYDPAFFVVATWFKQKRGRALTVLTFLAGFASVIFLPLTEALVSGQGWRGALVTLAVLLALITILPHALVLRRRPEDLGLLPDGAMLGKAVANELTPTSSPDEQSYTLRQALHTAAFWWLTAAFGLNMLMVVIITVHLIPYLTGAGYSTSFAASALGLIGVVALPGRLLFNLLGERVPRRFLTAFIFSLQVVALLVLIFVQNIVGVFIFIGLFGAGFGAITPMRAGLLAEFYGRAFYGSINGVLGLFNTGARALAPVGAGLIFDWVGNYNPVMWGLVGVSTVATLTIFLAEKPTLSARQEATRRGAEHESNSN